MIRNKYLHVIAHSSVRAAGNVGRESLWRLVRDRDSGRAGRASCRYGTSMRLVAQCPVIEFGSTGTRGAEVLRCNQHSVAGRSREVARCPQIVQDILLVRVEWDEADMTT